MLKTKEQEFKEEERLRAKEIFKLMKKNKQTFKVHRARHIFAQSFEDKELGYALIDYMLFKERRKGYYEGKNVK